MLDRAFLLQRKEGEEMVYITGDIHGEVHRVLEMIDKYEITPNDILVILGDVGMNYYGNKKGDRNRKK